MKRLQFAATIHAPVPAVWRPTIDPASHERWASAFADGRYFEGSCDEGAKIRLRSRPHGDGMDAEIARNRRHEFIAIRLLADEFIEFGSSGRVYTKADLVAVLQSEAPTRQTTSDFRFMRLGPDAALLTYRIDHHREPPVHTLRSSLWRRGGGHWRMVFHQATVAK